MEAYIFHCRKCKFAHAGECRNVTASKLDATIYKIPLEGELFICGPNWGEQGRSLGYPAETYKFSPGSKIVVKGLLTGFPLLVILYKHLNTEISGSLPIDTFKRETL